MAVDRLIFVSKNHYKTLEEKINQWCLGDGGLYWQIFRHPTDKKALVARRGIKGTSSIMIKEIES